ncbi:MAG: NAD(P)H-dependent oxidoreductase [Campylobacterota bacterium]|nr:NAD(P)H-dependent oxidoreductase [Campylobacterota bacterium]
MKNKFIDAMNFRHACKQMDPSKKISDEDFNTILESGRLSPSSFGTEPWKFLVIQNESLREKLKEFTWGAQGTLPSASHYVIILARKKKTMIHGSEYIMNLFRKVHNIPEEMVKIRSNFYTNFQEKDFAIASSEDKMFSWACRQTYIALANMMTGAAYIGVDSCPIEGYKKREATQFIKDELGVDTDIFDISVMAAFGYRINEQNPKTRQDMDTVTTWYR